MGRRRKSDAGGFLVLIAAALLFALAFLGPLAIIVWWLISEYRAQTVRNIQSISELAPTHSEMDQINRSRREEASLTQAIENAMTEGFTQSVSTRADGRFDGRSRKGKELNPRLDGLEYRLQSSQQQLAQLEGVIEDRIKNWVSIRAWTTASRMGMAIWLGMMATGWFARPQAAFRIGSIVTDDAAKQVLFGSSVIATVVAAVVMLAAVLIYSSNLRSQLK